ncbi:MAG TPA: GTP cyclohydrolase I FolE [Bacteroidales bacterium]|nr:GTP cyclohydrolase I FolE [Bacteroidales bacterium]HCI56253.1 GTP cyclohydrolase I FolE [Bacteroidales bacterium]HOU95894.1 GTP cyclohydrolase I FolE [Bacteroidales bacterium]HQG35877.1 GTP cyclohydrolase I FolE [Bacteroidales bacterium]HQG52387.1 GTP cyclohydrolase I FolE [Bacteroidales bacterium]
MAKKIKEIENGIEEEKSGYLKIEQWNKENVEEIAGYYRKILSLLGEDPDREGLLKTPERVAKTLYFMTMGYQQDARQILNSAKFREEYKHMVLVKDIDIYSLCEHHMLPFFGRAHVAYIPNEYITGLSKIARVVEAFSRRLQVQERLTVQIRDCIQECLQPMGVAVVIEAEHMCMQIRGVQKQNSVTTTSAFTGCFLDNFRTREEFMHLIGTKLH